MVEEVVVCELKEEIGYVCEVIEFLFVMFNDFGFMNINFKMVYVSVDMSLLQN